MTYVLHKFVVGVNPPVETMSATTMKNAKIRAYRIAMREKGNLNYIGIETMAKSKNPYHKITTRVTYADGKVWYSSGKTKKQLMSNGEFVPEKARKKSEDIFAWMPKESVQKSAPKSVPKTPQKTVQVGAATVKATMPRFKMPTTDAGFIKIGNILKESKKGKTVFTVSEFPMILSLDMRMMTYTEAKQVMEEMIKRDLLWKSGDYLKLNLDKKAVKPIAKTVPKPAVKKTPKNPNERTFGIWRVVIQGEGKKAIAKFYDMDADTTKFPNGQHVSEYYVETLLGKDGYGDDIRSSYGLSLYGGEPKWTVRQPELRQIGDWLESRVYHKTARTKKM